MAALQKIEVGLKGWDNAKRNDTLCYVCGEKIWKGSYRMDYRIRRGNRQGDNKRIHMQCMNSEKLIASRSADLVFLDQLLISEEFTSFDALTRQFLETVHDSWSNTGGVSAPIG